MVLLLPHVPGSASMAELVVGIRRLIFTPGCRCWKQGWGRGDLEALKAAWCQCRRYVRAEGGSIVNLGFAGDCKMLKDCPDKKGVSVSRNKLDF